MTQSQVTYFLTVAETLSFSKAAAVLFVSQPAVSKQVSLLEDELGLSLFDRTRQGVFLTDAGRLFRDLFQDYNERFRATLDEAHQLSHRVHDVICVGCSEDFHLSQFYSDIQTFYRERYPNLSLALSVCPDERLVPMLRDGQFDLILSLGALPENGPELTVQRLDFSKPFSAVDDHLNLVWLSSDESGGKHLFVNELLFHFKKILAPGVLC